ncbi:HEAT repeat domain-containing protein [Leptolyngbya sp. FACHB-671]|uniref:HEAT repeat domain-containing protein n=1 Tax=Leptolyngbya sp. FACHB-671 TaxID=2692812 RepID=UPI0016829F3E|nr:HEAT repeat domain-containing protein [Leptolyngbya sp. FACHB-671]MBD2066515.1 HEAT repeat domain-containing protein [Leptolyngbya sp. FACHB-671]
MLDTAENDTQFSHSWSNCSPPLSALANQYGWATPEDGINPELWLDLALDLFIEGDFQTRWDVAKLLPRFGTKAIAPLIAILEHEDTDWELLWFTVRTLGEFDHPVVVQVLISLLKTAEGELSAVAAEALANLGNQAIAPLTELLSMEQFRLLAVRSLSRIRHSQTIAPLLSITNDAQPEIRAAAIEALSSFHDPRVFPVLVNALQDPAAAVRREAVIAVGLRANLQAEIDLVNLLIPHLTDLNLQVCQQAAIALGRLSNPAAAQALADMLHSPHTPSALQIEIVRSLSWGMTATVLKKIQSILPCVSAEVYREMIAALGKVEDPALKLQAAEILITLLNSESSPQSPGKQAIALSLGHLGEIKALDPLIRLLSESDPGVQLHAIAALKQLAPDAAHEQLKMMAKDTNLPEALQCGVANALREW